MLLHGDFWYGEIAKRRRGTVPPQAVVSGTPVAQAERVSLACRLGRCFYGCTVKVAPGDPHSRLPARSVLLRLRRKGRPRRPAPPRPPLVPAPPQFEICAFQIVVRHKSANAPGLERMRTCAAFFASCSLTVQLICSDTAVWLIVGFVRLDKLFISGCFYFRRFADSGKFLSDLQSHLRRPYGASTPAVSTRTPERRSPQSASKPTAKISADSSGELTRALPTASAAASTLASSRGYRRKSASPPS